MATKTLLMTVVDWLPPESADTTALLCGSDVEERNDPGTEVLEIKRGQRVRVTITEIGDDPPHLSGDERAS